MKTKHTFVKLVPMIGDDFPGFYEKNTLYLAKP